MVYAVIRIDTHRDSHDVKIADANGIPITTMRIGNDSAGFARLLAPVRATPSASADRNGDPGQLDLTVRSSGPRRFTVSGTGGKAGGVHRRGLPLGLRDGGV